MAESSPPPATKDSSLDNACNRRETLASRAKRIIGRALEPIGTDDSNSAKPVAATSQIEPKGPTKKGPTKRREQVLQAQRTHRQRTQGYIKELEREVLKLRESTSNLQHDVDIISQKVLSLEQHIVVNAYTFPEDYQFSQETFDSVVKSSNFDIGQNDSTSVMTPTFTDTSTISSTTNVSPQNWMLNPLFPTINVDFNALQTIYTHNTPLSSPVLGDDMPLQFDTPLPSQLLQKSALPEQTPSIISPAESQSAWDFILALELVCFSHLKGQYLAGSLNSSNHNASATSEAEASSSSAAATATAEDTFQNPTVPILDLDLDPEPEPNHGPQHVYMATTNIINHHLPQLVATSSACTIGSTTDTTPNTNTNTNTITATGAAAAVAAAAGSGPGPASLTAPLTISGPELDALFRLGLSVDYGPDVTPVQMWANLHRLRTKGWVVDKEVLGRFVSECKKYMRCNGYGATIDKSIVVQLFSIFFPGEEYQDTF